MDNTRLAEASSETVSCCLEEGEQIRFWTGGLQRPPLWAALFFALLDSSGRSIMRHSDWYLVAVTDQRLLVLRYENRTMDFVEPDGPFKILEQQAWPLTALPPIKVTPAGPLSHVMIEIGDSTKPLKFNLPAAEALVAALTAATQGPA